MISGRLPDREAEGYINNLSNGTSTRPMISSSIEEVVEFFCSNNIPLLPCHGILNGICTCKKGKTCPSPGKHPLVFRWQMIASCKKETVLSWIGSGTKPINLAIRTGVLNPINGKYLVGADFDLINHPMKFHLAEISTTVTQQTGSGGDHSFYWSRYPIKNSVQLVDEKMDIRGSGGIMIIAPSSHKSGNPYRFTCNLQETMIQDLPQVLEDRLRASISAKKTASSKLDQPRISLAPSQKAKLWNDKSIAVLRNAFMNGEKIPVGARNSTMHRLLSSERAKGVLTFSELMRKGKELLVNFEDPSSLEDELESIAKSVMKYPAYNTSHKRVNELYLGWLKKNKVKSDYDLETLNKADEEYFLSLIPASNFENGMSLKDIANHRETFLKQRGITRFATYRPQLLAQKLKEMGINRKRTSKSNNWCIKPPEQKTLSVESQVCHNQTMTTKDVFDEMDGKVVEHNGVLCSVEVVKFSAPNTNQPREQFYSGRNGYEQNKALRDLMSRMTPDQIDNLSKGPESTLLMDKEKTVAWMNSVKPGDIIGVINKTYQVIEPPYPKDFDPDVELFVVEVKKQKGSFEPVKFLQTPFFTVWELDHARELGFLEILWRDGKPYGQPEMKDTTIILFHPVEEPKKDEDGE